MIFVSTALMALKASRKWHRAEVCRITLKDEATPIRLSTADYTISAPGPETFNPGFPLLARGDIVHEAGLNKQSLELRITPRPALDLVYDRSWLSCVSDGVFDGAKIEYLFAYSPADAPGDCSAGLEPQFLGEIAEAVPRGQEIIFYCEDPLRLLDTPHPVNLHQATCANTLYDARCGLSKATHTSTVAVGSGPTVDTIPLTSGVPAGVWDLGQVRFITGNCRGIRRMVRTWNGTHLKLTAALPRVPAPGDIFALSRGCLKTQAACAAFANSARWRAFPEIPVAETAF